MVNDLRKKNNKELGDLIVNLKDQLLEYRFKAAAGQLEKTHKIRIVKKTIAISFSILRERNVDLSISSHDYSLIEIQNGKFITKSIRANVNNSVNIEKINSVVKNNNIKKTSVVETIKKDSSNENNQKKQAPKKIVKKSNNNQAKKTNIVKKAQRGV